MVQNIVEVRVKLKNLRHIPKKNAKRDKSATILYDGLNIIQKQRLDIYMLRSENLKLMW